MSENLKPIIGPEEIRQTVGRIAAGIKADLGEKDPVLIGVLKGAAVFFADLIRALDIPFEIDFIQTSCYGKSCTPSGDIFIKRDIIADIKGRDVIIVECIVDSGKTSRALVEYLRKKGAKTVAISSLLERKGQRLVRVDYRGAEVDEGFIVGYGLDYKEKYRGLPGLYMITGL